MYIRHISFPVPYFCPTGLSSILRYSVLSVGFRASFHLPRSLVYKHLHGSCLHAHPRLVLFPGPKLRPSVIASCPRTIRMCVLYAVPYSAVNLTGMCAFRLRMLRRSCGSSSALQAVNGGWKSMIAHHRLAAESSMDVFFFESRIMRRGWSHLSFICTVSAQDYLPPSSQPEIWKISKDRN